MTAYKGAFQYVGGLPDIGKIPSSAKTQVVVDENGLTYERQGWLSKKYQPVFNISPSQIVGAVHNQVSADLFNSDQIIDVNVSYGNNIITAKFKAQGWTKQKDAFAFYSAISELKAIPTMV